jgi:hypothetical protein
MLTRPRSAAGPACMRQLASKASHLRVIPLFFDEKTDLFFTVWSYVELDEAIMTDETKRCRFFALQRQTSIAEEQLRLADNLVRRESNW